MLYNHKIKLKKANFIQDIIFERPSFSENGRVFTCYVPKKYNLADGDNLLLEINGNGTIQTSINVEDVIEQGWVELNTRHTLLDFEGDYASYDNNSADTVKWRYFIDNNGLVASGYEKTTSKGTVLDFPGLGTETTVYDTSFYPNTIEIPSVFYIENNIINYNGVSIYMDFDENNDIRMLQTILGTTVYVHDSKREKWKYLDKITIKLPNDILLKTDEIIMGKLEWFVEIDDTDYIFKERAVSANGHTYFQKYLPDADAYKPSTGTTGEYSETIPEYDDTVFYTPTIKLWDGIDHTLESRIVPSDGGNFLIMYVDTNEFTNIYHSKNIIAERLNTTNIAYYVENGTVEIDGSNYGVETVKMVDFDGLRELFSEEDNYFVTIGNGRKIYFKEQGDNVYLLFDKNITYPIVRRNKLKYNNIEYFKEIDTTTTSYPFMIPSKPSFLLEVVEIKEPNIYYCRLLDDDTNPYNGYRVNTKEWAYRDMVDNRGKYVFKVQPQGFVPNLSFSEVRRKFFEEQELPIADAMPDISLRRIISEMNIPLHLVTLHGTNLNQEIDVRGQFFEEKQKELINPIVDMEKDMYHPMVVESDGKTLTDASKIEFYLHLRTRNDDWTVRDDSMVEIKNDFEDKFITETEKEYIEKYGEIKYNDKRYYTSWNIMDYYEPLTSGMTFKNGVDNYYQPSDLLGFFDFTDDDIFYQKSKVSKTFLRLSFFDSKDPQKQSLLGTSTVFFDTRGFFGKFSDKMVNPVSNIRYKNPKTWLGTSRLISCNREPIVSERLVFVDDEFRMDSTVSITNKIANTQSAEGFYNYIFREYSHKLHERKIYLKIQLNHAGHGEVIDLFQPMFKDEDGLWKIASFDQIDKEGLPLNKLYDMMFIPINIKYDEANKKYCWYLPKEMTYWDENEKRNKIKFNLYEIKIKKT